MNRYAYWDKKELTIGVLGLSPYATIDFLRKLADVTPAKKDWEHVRVLVDINTKIPSRGRALELGEEDPSPYMRKAIQDLHKNGADFVVIPCNTSHYFFDKVTKDLDVPVLNIIEETTNYILSYHPKIKKVGLMASWVTVNYKLYDKFLKPKGVSLLTLPEKQSIVSEIIESVKVGNDGFEIKEKTRKIADDLIELEAEGIILGCTEIPLVINETNVSVPVFDSNKILAKSALAKAKAPCSVL